MSTKNPSRRGAQAATGARGSRRAPASPVQRRAPADPAAEALALDRRLAAIASLEDRLLEIARTVPGRVTFSTSLGIEDQAVLNGIAASRAAIDVFTLDTGRHFPETLETLEASESRYGIKIRVMFPDAREVEELVARDGIFGFRLDVENRKACCDVRKVRPLKRALAGAAGWVTGLRREQSAGRAHVPFAAWDAENGLVKLNPIADWSLEQLEAYVAANNVPVHPLHARGFPSIGCQPCTRAIKPGEDIRAGRWWWENEDGKECGLHNRPRQKEAAA
ncbi:MAG: phosphoadenylyl-sulfate reductase [Hyphomicrobium sp.]